MTSYTRLASPDPAIHRHVKKEGRPYVALVPEVDVLDQQPLWTRLDDLHRNRLTAAVQREQPPIGEIAPPGRLKNRLGVVLIAECFERVPEDANRDVLAGCIVDGAKVTEKLVVLGTSGLYPGPGNNGGRA